MPLLSLDDARWNQLSHAYGPATDVPDQLRALERGDDRDDATDRDELFWSALCHQGTVYTATYAAVPHVVAIGAQRPWTEQFHFWMFVGKVAESRDAAPVPTDLLDAFEAAVRRASELAPAGFVRSLDESDATWLAVAVAGLRRQYAIAYAVEGLCDEELSPVCPQCKTDLHITVTEPPFVVNDEDPVRGDGGKTSLVTSLKPRTEIRELAELARAADLEDLAARILALDGRATCPSCGHAFDILDVCGAP